MAFDRTKPYGARNGRKAEIVHTLKDGRLVVIYDEDDCAILFPTGRWTHIGGDSDNDDLVNLPERKITMEFDKTKPYGARNGRKAEIVHTLKDGRFIVVYDDGESYTTVMPNGRFYSDEITDNDLVNIPEKRTVVINHYTDGRDTIHHTLLSAEECVCVEWYDRTILEYERPVYGE